MSVAKKILMGSGAVDDYEIDQSLTFDDGNNAYLDRTPGSASNQKTWTFSAWIKRGDSTPFQSIWSAYDNSTANNSHYFNIGFYNA